MDEKLFLLMYNFTHERKAVAWVVKRLTELSKSFFFVLYGMGAVLLLVEAPLAAVRFLAIPFLVLCYNSLLRKLIGRERPFVRFKLEPLSDHEANGSCPSNHAASAMIISLAFWLISPYVSAVLIVLALFTGISRVCAGIHYPLDVLIGWAIGAVTGVLGFIVL
jgi:undecaprenyl-diphosphatase